MKNKMPVVILCGGYGTRIRDVADNIPKPMIPVGDKPILWHIMKYYAQWGHDEFILCLGYKGDMIRSFFLNYEALTQDFTITLGSNDSIEYHNRHNEENWRVTLAETGLNAMTGARLKRIQRYLNNNDNFMLTYGDGVGDVDIDKLLEFHLSHDKLLTVTGVRPPGRFGEMLCDLNGQVSEFNEKPQAAAGKISGGFFICRKEIFNYLDDREDLIFEQEPVKKLVEDSQMMMYEHDGFWQPMDTSREYNLLNKLYNTGKAPWKIWD
jgi:glucose-1-phosphate cytidylyltransferase